MSEDRRTRLLQIVLFGSAAALSFAFVAAWIPESWIDAGHRAIGFGGIPATPVFEYLARSIAMLYGLHGVLAFLIARDVRRYPLIVRYVGGFDLVFGVAITVIDIDAGMPLPWILLEGPPTAGVGLIVLLLSRGLGGGSPAGPEAPRSHLRT